MRKPHGIKPQDRTYSNKLCAICGDEFTPTHPRLKRCSKCQHPTCSACGVPLVGLHLGRLLANQNRVCHECVGVPVGSRRVDSVSGYVRIKTVDGWEPEHRVVMERKLGRRLLPTEIVHHDNRNRADNSPDNLILCSSVRDHLDRFHKDDLVPPPIHHNGRKRKSSCPYVNAARQAAAAE